MWVYMETGGRMLVNLPAEKRVILIKPPVQSEERTARYGVRDTYTSHFATCPKADEHRRKHEN